MTVPRIKTSAGWVDLQKVGPQGPSPLLDFRSIYGASDTYSAAIGPSATVDISNGSVPLALTYTPPVPVWWETFLNVGLLSKEDAAYGLAYVILLISPADADGGSQLNAGMTQHLTVDRYGSRSMQRTWKLNAGVAYTVKGMLSIGAANGSWTYYRGQAYLALEAKAWAR